MNKTHIRRLVLCLGLSASVASIARGQSLQPTRLSGVTQGQLAQADSWLEWQHYTSLFTGQAALLDNPYLDAWSVRATSRAYTKDTMLELLKQATTSIDRERIKLVIGLDYLEDTRALLQTQSKESETLQQAFHQAADYLEQVNPIGLVGGEYTQWLVARAYALMSLTTPQITKAKALLSEATEQDNPWGEKALLYLAMLEHAEGRTDVALRLLKDQVWSAALAPEARYQELLIGLELLQAEQLIIDAQNAAKRYPQLAHRPRFLGAMGIAYYKLGDWNNVLRTLEPLGTGSKLTPSESYALGAAYYALGQLEQATPQLEHSATSSKGQLSGMAQFALGNIYAKRGDASRAGLAYTSVVQEGKDQLPQSIIEDALYRLIELNFASGYDVFGQQTGLVERFLDQYPTSRHQVRVLELLRQYCHTNTDYRATLGLLQKLSHKGERLRDVRQEVLVRYANAIGSKAPEYRQLLDEAIALGSGRESYTIALIMRGAKQLEDKNYAEAGQSLTLALEQRPWGSAYDAGLAHYLLGYTRYNEQRYAEALSSFARFSGGGASRDLRSDAFSRMGDCLMNDPKRHTEALKYYEEAIALGSSSSDEAHRRMVRIYGLRGEYAAQIREANKFVSAYPKSAYLPEVLYLEGRATALSQGGGKAAEAHKIYSRVEHEYPSSPYASLSALERALLYASDGDSERAIPAYKRVVEQYPTSVESKTALSDLKTLYAELDRLDEYVQYAGELMGGRLPEDQNLEELSLRGIEARLRRGQDATAELKRWVESHPKSRELYDAEKLLAQTYYAQKRYPEAETLLAQMATRYTANSQQLLILELLAATHKAQSNTPSMLDALSRAYKLSRGDVSKRTKFALELAEEAYAAGVSQTALEVASEELKSEGLSQESKEKLTLIKGKTQELLKAIKGAVQTYATLEGNYMSPQGAEAAVRRAELMIRLEQYSAAEELLEQLTTCGTPQRYWLARGFIALSDCHAAQGETYLATQYLKNLRDSYENPEEDITEMITTRLNKLKK